MSGGLSRAVGRSLSVVFRLAIVIAVVGTAGALAAGAIGVPSGLGGLASGLAGTANGDVTPVSPSNTSDLNGTRVELLVHNYTNRERVQHDRSKLAFDPGLRDVARYHSADMANRSYFAHVSPSGRSVAERYDARGYRCRVWTGGLRVATGGENILKTYYEAPVGTDGGSERYETETELAHAIVDGWMNSTEHRENLLKPYWNREGIGINVTRENGQTAVYATQDFC